MAQKYRSSAATRKNRKERRKKTLKGGKAGNQGIFHGARDALLWYHFPALLDLKGKPQTDADAFWRTLYAEYWSLFPWRLPLDKEPDAEGDWSEPSEMSEEMQAEKAMIIKRTQTQIKNTMRYRRNARVRQDINPWTGLLSALRHYDTLPTPRRLPAWQLYMSRKAKEIGEVFADRWGDSGLPDSEGLKFRGCVARELLAQEPIEYRQELEEECARRHEQDLSDHDRGVFPEATDDPELQERARQDLVVVVQPLLELLREYTGLYFALIAGVPNPTGEKDFCLKLVNAGKNAYSTPLHWHALEGKRFTEEVMASFTRFLMTTPEYAERVANMSGTATPSQSTPSLSSLGLNLAAPQIAVSFGDKGGGTTTTAASVTASRKGKGKAVQPAARKKTRGSKRRSGRGRNTDPEDEVSAEESEEDEDEDEERFTDKEEEDDEEEEGGEDEEEGDVPGDDEDVPTPEELGIGPGFRAELDALPEGVRRRRLYNIASMLEFDRIAYINRNEHAANMRRIREESGMFPKRKAARSKVITSTVDGPTRQSERLRAHQGADSETVPLSGDDGDGNPEQMLNAQGTAPGQATSTASTTTAPPPSTTTAPPPSTTTAPPPSTTATATASQSTSVLPTTPLDISAPPPLNVSAPSTAPPHTTTPPHTTAPPITTASSTVPLRNTTATASVTGTAAPATTAPPPVLSAPRPIPPLHSDKWPPWIREMYTHLTGLGLGEEYQSAVDMWTLLEGSYDFATPPQGLSTTGRPKEVSEWMKWGRKIGKPPTMRPGTAFAQSWWAWWRGLQPDWRRPIEPDGALSRDGIGGDWGDLVKPGKNGIILVLLTLAWWKGAETGETSDDWLEATADVAWVVYEMASGTVPSSSKRGCEAETPASTRPSKRRRR